MLPFALLAAGFLGILPPQQSPLTLGFLDVGQGDATVIASPEGRIALVDGGRSSHDIAERLLAMGVDTVDLIVATHADADHIGGLEGVLQQLVVGAFLDNGVPHTTATYRGLLEGIEESDVTYLAATARTIALGSVTIRVLPPPADATSQNDASVGVLVEYGDFRTLLVGDAEQEELAHFLRLGLPAVSVLEASHHGARNGVTPAWIATTAPRVVVISVGLDNTYGHPNPWALRYYGARGRPVFRTDLHGDVWISAARDGSFVVETEFTYPGDTLPRTFAAEVRR
jgi:competence protein ComEC